MAKFTGYMCDVCKCAETGNDRPGYWLAVRMPANSDTATAEYKDVCSDKCLLKFAKERAGVGAGATRQPKAKIAGLSEFLDEKGIKPSAKGAVSAAHARQRHEMSGGREDCYVCEFLGMREAV